MVQVPFYDLVEVMQGKASAEKDELVITGIPVPGPSRENLLLKALQQFREQHLLPPLRMHLHKQVPPGTGLGGGSSNATTLLRALNKMSGNPLDERTLHAMAASLGSDCPVFLHDTPVMASGRGDILSPCRIRLEGYYVVIVYPNIHLSTAEAYSKITPDASRPDLANLLDGPIDKWRHSVFNDFEKHLFAVYPLLAEIKEALYASGSIFASLTGSGSALFGIFNRPPKLTSVAGQPLLYSGPL
jgi:4-diphosphocytidyl-2-C-methyl-D-erythritol kinase